MKKLIGFVIFFVLLCLMLNNHHTQIAYAVNSGDGFVITTNNSEYSFCEKENTERYIQNKYSSLNIENKKAVADKMLKMGFDKQTIIGYLFPSAKLAIQKIEKEENKAAQNASVVAVENCKIQFKNGKNGSIFNKKAFYNAFFDNFIKKKCFEAKFENVSFDKSINDIKPYFQKCSEVSTDFSASGEARKNNIKLATQAINGIIINPGEEFSFNKTTGLRNAENGYSSAKIIVGGEYVEGFGGGVCQVSTTLYNAALLSGLKITEVHPHSLPSSYIEPGFDAMVNMGSSDLKFLNNTENSYILTASANSGVCRVAIYGVCPQFKIKKHHEKYDIIKPQEDKIKTEYNEDIEQEYSERVSYGSDGYKVKAYIDYYDGDILVKTEKIRDCKYNAKQGLVVEYKKGKNKMEEA